MKLKFLEQHSEFSPHFIVVLGYSACTIEQKTIPGFRFAKVTTAVATIHISDCDQACNELSWISYLRCFSNIVFLFLTVNESTSFHSHIWQQEHGIVRVLSGSTLAYHHKRNIIATTANNGCDQRSRTRIVISSCHADVL